MSSTIEGVDDAEGIFYEVPEDTVPPRAAGDAFALAVLLPAMRLKLPLIVEAPISTGMRANLMELQALYSMWFPEFSVVEIHSEVLEDADGVPRRRGATALFFSGGVDSFYSLLAYPHTIDRLIYVDALDTLSEDDDLRVRIRTSIQATAAGAGLPLLAINTNVRGFLTPYSSWPRHAQILAPVSVGHVMTGLLGTCVVSTDRTYLDLTPFGSHLVTARMFGSSHLRIDPFGWGVDRLDKVAAIAGWDLAMTNLRVCWQNPDGAFNCGLCEKCMRTKIALTLAGALDRCRTLDHNLDLDAVAALDLSAETMLTYAIPALDRARTMTGHRDLADALAVATERALAVHAADRVDSDIEKLARSGALTGVVTRHRDDLYRELSAHHGRWLVARVLREIPSKTLRKLSHLLKP